MQYAEALRFAENLNSIMARKGLTKYRLAKMIPCSPSTVANWLNGIVPRGLMKTRLLEVLEVTEEKLFINDELPGPTERAGDEVGINPKYFELSEEDRAAVDMMIERLALLGRVAKADQ